MIGLLRLTKPELSEILQCVAVNGTGPTNDNPPGFKLNKQVSYRNPFVYSWRNVVAAGGIVTAEVLGPGGTGGISGSPWYLGYVDHKCRVAQTAVSGEYVGIQGQVAALNSVGVPAVSLTWKKEFSLFTDITGEVDVMNENLPHPILFQNWQVTNTSLLTGIFYEFNFTGIQIYLL